jgi:hypothetical protein
MRKKHNKPTRTWQQIAEEASREQDPEKLRGLAKELERALDERRRKLYPENKPDSR